MFPAGENNARDARISSTTVVDCCKQRKLEVVSLHDDFVFVHDSALSIGSEVLPLIAALARTKSV